MVSAVFGALWAATTTVCVVVGSFDYFGQHYHGCYGLDGENKPREVDWFAVVKLPKIKESENELVRQGVGFIYVDSIDSNQWRFVNQSICEQNSFLFKTIDRFNSSRKFGAYNDQPPVSELTQTNHGHSKGVFGFGENEGFWIMHSVPHFPAFQTNLTLYPETGKPHGQHIFCVSLPNSNLLASVLDYINPLYYHEKNLDKNKSELYQNSSNTLILPTGRENLSVEAFVKSGGFHADIYADLMTNGLEDAVVVQSWLTGIEPMGSECTRKYSVENVVRSRVPNLWAGPNQTNHLSFPSSTDHSKWAIGKTRKTVCFGDLNRHIPHVTRAGGLYCIADDNLWNRYNEMILDLDNCSIVPELRSSAQSLVVRLVVMVFSVVLAAQINLL